jgi:hypothetical protein
MFSVYIFEAKSVQAFVLAGGRLRDMVGGSALLDWMTSDDVDDKSILLPIVKAFGNAAILRAAGGAITVLFNGGSHARDAHSFRALWRFQVHDTAPGLFFADGIGSGSDNHTAISTAQSNARVGVNARHAELPQAIPPMAQSQRMAAPAAYVAGKVKMNGLCKITKERADHAILAKRYFGNPEGTKKTDRLGMMLANGNADYLWPNEFDPDDAPEGSVLFPFGDNEEREIAIIHADGDGIGSKIISLMQNATNPGGEMALVSRALTKATKGAAIAATKKVLIPNVSDDGILAARPVLLGGDDLTMIVRADMALDFLVEYCREFERLTKEAFAGKPEGHPFRLGVTASGAAVFIKARQPFSKALELTDALTRYAKEKGGGHISFFRCTTSKIPISVAEAWPKDGLSIGPLQLTPGGGFTDLLALVKVLKLEAVGRAGLYRMLSVDDVFAKSELDRAAKIMDRRFDGEGEKPSQQLNAALLRLGADIDQNGVRVNAALRDAFLLHRLGMTDAD